MSKLNAADARKTIFDDEEAGDYSSDESKDSCEFIDDEDGEENIEEEELNENEAFIQKKFNETKPIPPSSSHMSFSTSINSFKVPVIPSSSSSMSISSSRFAVTTPKTKTDGVAISTTKFFPVVPSPASCSSSISNALGI
jgi:hypothetical protein